MLAYWKMLWLNRLAPLKPGSWQGGWKKRLGYGLLAVLAVLGYAAVVALEMLLYAVAQEMGDPEAIIALAFLGCTLVTLIYSFFSVFSQLFFGKDMSFLAALPIRSQGIMLVKLSNVLLSETMLAMALCTPIMIRHGVAIHAHFGYYFRALLVMLTLAGIPVAITTALSFVLIRVSALWKRREGVTTIATFLFMGLLIFGELMLSMSVEETEISAAVIGLLFGRASISRLMMSIYPPLKWMLTGLGSWGYALLFAAVSAGAVALVTLLFGKSYMGLAVKQMEVRRRENAGRRKKEGAGSVRSPFLALYRQEMKEIITVPAYATNCLAGVVMFPVMLVIMLIAARQEAGPAVTAMLTGIVPRDVYLMIAAAFLGLTATMNMAVPTAVSREGARHEMRRTYPVSGKVQLQAKLAMGLTYNAVMSLVCAVVMCVLLPAFWVETMIALVIAQLYSLLWSTGSLLIDVYRPKLNWKNETEAVKQSMNAMIGMLMGLGFLLVLAGVVVACWLLNAPLWSALVLDCVLMLIGSVLLWKWLTNQSAKAYIFKEFSNL